MGRGIVNGWTRRNDPKRVYGRMASVVMPLDVRHVDRAAHSRNLVDVFRVIEQVRVLAQQFLVAFEMNCIDL